MKPENATIINAVEDHPNTPFLLETADKGDGEGEGILCKPRATASIPLLICCSKTLDQISS
jgi:hypothetical protein